MMKKSIFSIGCLIVFPCLMAFPISAETSFKGTNSKQVQLAKGEQYKLPVAQGSRFSIGNPEVIRVKPTTGANGRSMLLVQGRSLGFSDLVVFSGKNEKIYKFRVFAKRSAAFAKDVQGLLRGMPGVRVEQNGNNWIISGEAHSVEDFEKIQTLSANAPKKIKFLGGLSSSAKNVVFHKLQELFEDAGIEGVSVRTVGKAIWLEGKVTSKRDKTVAETIARSVYPSIDSHIEVAFESGEVLRFEIKMLEALRADKDRVGFSWSTNIPKIFQIHKHFTKGNFSLDSSLDILANKGLVKVLSKPMIYVNERGKAELRVGGEIPLKIQTRYRQNISWKSYGLLLQIQVPGHANGLTRAKIKIEISDLDFSNAIDGLPGLRVNKMETEVDLSDGKTVFLSGLLQTQKQKNEQGIALLKDIPILGELFKSRSFLERKSELLIAVAAVPGGAR